MQAWDLDFDQDYGCAVILSLGVTKEIRCKLSLACLFICFRPQASLSFVIYSGLRLRRDPDSGSYSKVNLFASLILVFYFLPSLEYIPFGLENKKPPPKDGGSTLLSGWQDSNLRPPAPKAGAITGLRYTPRQLALINSNYKTQIPILLFPSSRGTGRSLSRMCSKNHCGATPRDSWRCKCQMTNSK